jgi:4-diphosphocytidyl-2-C-methyl-D-erythritol kinase
MRLAARAYAKINLGLLIHEKRKDGYHEIETVFHRIDLSDLLVLESAATISLSTDSAEIPPGESNLCWKAASLISEPTGGNRGVRITLTKRIPVGAGLGGGSADAACVLRVLPRLWNVDVPEEKLAECALQLGSDVPFFLGKESAHGTGRGEELRFFPLNLPFAIVVCYPGIQVPTPWAYGQIRSFLPRERGKLGERMRDAIPKPSSLCALLSNDFETPVFAQFAIVADLKKSLLTAGALCAALSGSGSSVYGLFADDAAARRAAEILRSDQLQTFFTCSGFHIPQNEVFVS